MEDILEYKGHKIHYHSNGKGEKLLFAFAGFADDASMFQVLEPSLGEYFKVIAINLPFHGKTEWDSKVLFLKSDLKNIIRLFLKKENKNSFSLIGYSLGGKISMILSLMFSDQLENLILAAPDGIKTRKAYDLAVYPSIGRKLFSVTVQHPGWLLGTIHFLRFIRAIPDSLLQFLKTHLKTKESRQRLYDTWTALRDFKVDKTATIQNLNERNIPVLIIYGKFDPVMKVKDGKEFSTKIKNSHFIEMDKGHRLVKEYLGPEIMNFIKSGLIV